MHKEAPLTKNQKEQIKYKNMRERDAFDRANLRGYRQSYPHPDAVSIINPPKPICPNLNFICPL